MKKKYTAPTIAIEYFELTQSIADCSIKIGFLDNACVKRDADAPSEMKQMAWSEYFVQDQKGCSYSVVEGNDYDGICYHTSINAAFNS